MASETMTSRTVRSRLTIPPGSGGLMTPSSSSSTTSASLSSSAIHHHQPVFDLSCLTDLKQMDWQSALDQMRCLMSGRPHVVYKTAYYRKQTKNHWYRDDPAFAVLQVTFLTLASCAYSVAFRTSLTEAWAFFLNSIILIWWVMGALVATLTRELANRHLLTTQSSSHVQQSVEWMYAFDIHCNSFFPCFCLLYVLQFFMLPLVLGQSMVSLIISNALYAIAFSWYWYITHLGYRSLPFLTNTEVFLFPIAAILLVFLLNLIGYPFGVGWNASRLLAQLFFY